MQKNILNEKKKLILFLSVLILFSVILTGCNWFENGIINVFDPQAQIRVDLTDISYGNGDGSVNLEIFSLNEVEFNGEGFEYKYYSNNELILTKTVGRVFYVEKSPAAGTKGPITTIEELPLFYRDIRSYMTSSPLGTEVTCNISIIGTDGAAHSSIEPVVVNLPIDFFPDINIIVSANPSSFDSSGGTSTITAYVVDDYSIPVGGLNVIFSSTGGTLSSNNAVTNSNGMAAVTLILPENKTDEDVTYDITVYVGSEDDSTSVTVKGLPENVDNE